MNNDLNQKHNFADINLQSFTEFNPSYRYDLLKKYFIKQILNELNNKMQVLNSSDLSFDEYKQEYLNIAQTVYLKILLAINNLTKEKNIDADGNAVISEKFVQDFTTDYLKIVEKNRSNNM